MKPVSLLVLIAFSMTIIASPCQDTLLLELKTKPYEELTDTERYYLRDKEEQCRKLHDSLATAQKDSIEQAAKEHKWTTQTKPLIVTGIVFGVIGMITLFIVAMNNDDMWVEVGGQRVD